MPTLNFPNAPALNERFTSGLQTWEWDGISWNIVATVINTSEASTVLNTDGQILTRASGILAPISRVDLAADPAFTSQYGSGSVSVGPDPPITPTAGEMWWDTDDISPIPSIDPVALANSLAFTSAFASLSRGVETGTTVFTIRATPSVGWLFLDGATIVNGQTIYPDLWAIIPSTWKIGANILLPDARGRVIIAAGTGAGLTNRPLGSLIVGEESHKLVTAEMPIHNHSYITDSMVVHPFSSEGGTTAYVNNAQVVNGTKLGAAVPNAGGDGFHNNMQPSFALNCMIKT